MSVTPSYPGVYIEELPSPVHPITGVTTSVAAFVDVFASGPVNKAIQISSVADFARVFGGYSADSESSYAIPQFFLNGGQSASSRQWLTATCPRLLTAHCWPDRRRTKSLQSRQQARAPGEPASKWSPATCRRASSLISMCNK